MLRERQPLKYEKKKPTFLVSSISGNLFCFIIQSKPLI